MKRYIVSVALLALFAACHNQEAPKQEVKKGHVVIDSIPNLFLSNHNAQDAGGGCSYTKSSINYTQGHYILVTHSSEMKREAFLCLNTHPMVLKFDSVYHKDHGDTTEVVEFYKNSECKIEIDSFLRMEDQGYDWLDGILTVTDNDGEVAKTHIYGVCGAN